MTNIILLYSRCHQRRWGKDGMAGRCRFIIVRLQSSRLTDLGRWFDEHRSSGFESARSQIIARVRDAARRRSRSIVIDAAAAAALVFNLPEHCLYFEPPNDRPTPYCDDLVQASVPESRTLAPATVTTYLKVKMLKVYSQYNYSFTSM